MFTLGDIFLFQVIAHRQRFYAYRFLVRETFSAGMLCRGALDGFYGLVGLMSRAREARRVQWSPVTIPKIGRSSMKHGSRDCQP